MDKHQNEEASVVTIAGERDPAKMRKWEAVHAQYRPLPQAGKRSAAEVLAYVREKYPTRQMDTPAMHQVAAGNAEQHMRMFGAGDPDRPDSFRTTVLHIPCEGSAAALYDTQQQEYTDFIREIQETYPEAEDIPPEDYPMPILVFTEATSGFVSVEGSPGLADDLLAYQGLSEAELENPYCVYRYIQALEKTGRLEQVAGSGL